MIECNDNVFRLATAHTAYLFRVTPFGHLEHLHYGGPVSVADGAALAAKTTIARGSSILYDESSDTYCLDDLPRAEGRPSAYGGVAHGLRRRR